MADNVIVDNFPKSGSVERVAFDLMSRIAGDDFRKGGNLPSNPKEYFLDLYAEAYHVVKYGYREDSKST